MSYQCGLLFEVKVEPLDSVLMVATPVGLSKLCDRIVKNFPFWIGDSALPANLVLMDMVDFDIILGMDWLSTYHASVDYFNKEIKSSRYQVEKNLDIRVLKGDLCLA